MNDQLITPLERCRLEKRKLKESCRQQEDQLRRTLNFCEDNFIPLSLKATAKTFMGSGKLLSLAKMSSSDANTSDNSPLGQIPKSVVDFALKMALGFFIKKKFGKRSMKARVLGMALPVIVPIVSTGWQSVQAAVWGFVKRRRGF